jgi:hydroxymethylpyrimidine/phosphomethylpyrimidine kinase
MSQPRCLSIAGSDSGGGAGIQADLRTFAAFGCYGTSAITALTAQNTKGVEDVEAPPPDFVARQIAMVVQDIGVDAAKTGMLFSAEIIRAVSREIRRLRIRPVVVDPVMVATSGDRLLREDAVEALRADLLPLASVVTPNIAEAETLSGMPIFDDRSAYAASRRIRELGPEWVLLKGGDRAIPGISAEDEAADILVGPGGLESVFAGTRVAGVWHGTGCTLSAAICARLALGDDVPVAVREAKAYLQGALEHAERIGGGASPVNHLWRQSSPVLSVR